jgi:hypothetical protein
MASRERHRGALFHGRDEGMRRKACDGDRFERLRLLRQPLVRPGMRAHVGVARRKDLLVNTAASVGSSTRFGADAEARTAAYAAW